MRHENALKKVLEIIKSPEMKKIVLMISYSVRAEPIVHSLPFQQILQPRALLVTVQATSEQVRTGRLVQGFLNCR